MAIHLDIQKYIDDGVLRHVSSRDGYHDYVVDSMSHDERSSIGKQRVIFVLSIDENTSGEGDDPYRYEINRETENRSRSTVLATNDEDEVVSWFVEHADAE